MCDFKTTVIPLIIWALGIVKKGTNKDNNKIPSSLCLQEIKKWKTGHLLKEVLSVERKYKLCT